MGNGQAYKRRMAKSIAIGSVIGVAVALYVILFLAGAAFSPYFSVPQPPSGGHGAYNLLGNRLSPSILANEDSFSFLRLALLLVSFASLILGRCRGFLSGIIFFTLLVIVTALTMPTAQGKGGFDSANLVITPVTLLVELLVLFLIGKFIEMVARWSLARS